eukprot:2075664-Rhodomonas_salina.1
MVLAPSGSSTREVSTGLGTKLRVAAYPHVVPAGYYWLRLQYGDTRRSMPYASTVRCVAPYLACA